jgi:hypothetical protein
LPPVALEAIKRSQLFDEYLAGELDGDARHAIDHFLKGQSLGEKVIREYV